MTALVDEFSFDHPQNKGCGASNRLISLQKSNSKYIEGESPIPVIASDSNYSCSGKELSERLEASQEEAASYLRGVSDSPT